MKIALAIVSLFASGGLQRDCLSLARILRRRGHDVHLIAARCANDIKARNDVTVLPLRHLTNHGRDASFARALQAATHGKFDVVVGFNKMPGLDVLYCADRSVWATSLPVWKRWLPRQHVRSGLEEACFGKNSGTRILLLSARAADEYRSAWDTPGARITVLPPTVSRERIRPDLRTPQFRSEIRRSLGLEAADTVWLFVAAYPYTKGFDRLLHALSEREGVRVVVAGVTAGDRDVIKAVGRAKPTGLDQIISFLGHREDIPELMAAADVLVHPARYDMTGGVILEAICSGLPVITTDACGFADHVRAADAGIVVDTPFDANRLDEALNVVNKPGVLETWSQNASRYAAANDFTRGLHEAADVIEGVATRRRREG